jgi:spermidine/putrescine ABC transporter ATP-binding subunit
MATTTEPAIAPTHSKSTSLLSIRSVAKHFGKNIVLRDISLEIAEGEFLTILGESGSGKTTLLRILAGFEQSTAGEVWMQGERLDTQPPYRRRVNTVFQHYALFPHMTVEQNVGYGLAIAKRPPAEIESRVDEALAKVKMSAYAKSKPSKISGGQQQRIALARALVNRPQLLLLDEPLSALDANLRRQMQVELKALQREVGITFIFVTHDQEEAMVMSDRIALLRSGELEQVASPREIYNHPATSYTAQFIGHTNLLQAEVRQGTAICGSLQWPTRQPDGPTLFSLRPECIQPATSAAPNDATVSFRATLRDQAFHGATDLLRVESDGGLIMTIRTASRDLPDSGALLQFEFNAADAIPVRATSLNSASSSNSEERKH